jgi:ABC-type hemin transport system substrate-binding protein
VQRAFSLRPRLHAAVFVCALIVAGCTREPAPAAPHRIDRVVTLAPNVTEIVFALGAGDRVVGTDDFSDYPPPAKALPKLGGVQANIEKIAALKPDLVIAKSGYHPTLPAALAAAKVPLFVSVTDRLGEIAPAMSAIAQRLGVDSAPAVAKLQAAVDAQRRTRAKKPRVLFVVLASPLYVAGRETFADDVFNLCGAENAVAVSGWPQYSLESLAANPPDLIVHPNRTVARAEVDALLKTMPNAKVRVVAVDEDRFSRPGPRVGEAAAELNAILDTFILSGAAKKDLR